MKRVHQGPVVTRLSQRNAVERSLLIIKILQTGKIKPELNVRLLERPMTSMDKYIHNTHVTMCLL